jgi:hypothetical protein
MVTVTILLWVLCGMGHAKYVQYSHRWSKLTNWDGRNLIWKIKGVESYKMNLQSIIKMLKWPCYNDLKLCSKVFSCSKKMVASIYHYIFNLKLFPCNVVFHLINCIFFITCLSCLWVAQKYKHSWIDGLIIITTSKSKKYEYGKFTNFLFLLCCN